MQIYKAIAAIFWQPASYIFDLANYDLFNVLFEWADFVIDFLEQPVVLIIVSEWLTLLYVAYI